MTIVNERKGSNNTMKSDPIKVTQLYAIYCAEAVLHIFENKHPDDNRPRLAIEAAKKCLKDPTKKNKDNAYAAAIAIVTYAYAASADAAYAAYRTAADYVVGYAADYAAAAAKRAAEFAHETIDFDALKSKAANDILEF